MENIYKPLKFKERKFVNDIVYQGLTPMESYSKNFEKPITLENKKKLKANAARLMNKDNIITYYNAIMEEVREKETKKAVWTKEVATTKLMALIEKAEKDIYEDDKPLTMGRLNAIMMPAKELNLMNGLNQTNLNVTGQQVVQFIGEDDILD